ncbi:hypothetical protein F5877DRAFT_72656 [Lentinula edodes]|nr:hypothetical protein F5877DRAFT_72656 [Lentinula edodes]
MKRVIRTRTRKATKATKKKRKEESFATYEVGFIRTATKINSEDGVIWKYLIHWKGWLEETNEPAYALRYAGDALTLFWINVENPHDIYYDEDVDTVVLPNQTYIDHNMDKSEDDIDLPPTYSQNKITTTSSNPGPTGFDGPSQETILIDPKTLWLPPDRLGFDCKNWRLLYQIVCLSIDTAAIGISSRDFFQTIKKARKEHKSDDWAYSESCVHKSDDWAYSESCVVCEEHIGKVVTTCLCFKKSYCAVCAVGMIKQSHVNGFFKCPCCRQDPVFFVAIEWAFISDPDAQLRQRAAGKRRREAAKKARKRDHKMKIHDQCAEIELEDGEIQE